MQHQRSDPSSRRIRSTALSKIDRSLGWPSFKRERQVALAASEPVGIAETSRARLAFPTNSVQNALCKECPFSCDVAPQGAFSRTATAPHKNIFLEKKRTTLRSLAVKSETILSEQPDFSGLDLQTPNSASRFYETFLSLICSST